LKNIFIISIFVLSLFGSELSILKGNKRDTVFLKGINLREAKNSSKNRIYYIYGIKESSSKVISNGTLIITFKNEPNIQQFVEKNNLSLIRKNSTGSYIFLNLENIDIIDKSNNLIKIENIKYVSPNWKRIRGLK